MKNEPIEKEKDGIKSIYFDLGTVFEILINTGFIKYNIQAKDLDEAVLESEKKVVFLIWGLLEGEKNQLILKENL